MSSDDARPVGDELLASLRANPHSDEAWTRFYNYMFKQLSGALIRSGCPSSDIEDVTNDIFVKVLERSEWLRDWSRLPDYRTLLSYFRRVGQNLLIDRYRRNRNFKRTDAVDLDLFVGEWIHDLDVPLRHVLADLNDDERQLVRMLIDGVPLPAIAFDLQITYGAAGVRVHRLRKKIETSLGRTR